MSYVNDTKLAEFYSGLRNKMTGITYGKANIAVADWIPVSTSSITEGGTTFTKPAAFTTGYWTVLNLVRNGNNAAFYITGINEDDLPASIYSKCESDGVYLLTEILPKATLNIEWLFTDNISVLQTAAGNSF